MNYKIEIQFRKGKGNYQSIVDQLEFSSISSALQNDKNFFLERDGLVTWFIVSDISTVVFQPTK